LRFDGRVAGSARRWTFSKLDYFLGAELTLPGRFTPDTDIVIGGYFEREVLDLYTKNRGSASVYANHFFSDELTPAWAVSSPMANMTTSSACAASASPAWKASVEYDTRDNKLDPKDGFTPASRQAVLRVGVRQRRRQVRGRSPRLPWLRAEDRTVLAARLKVGSIIGAPISQIPQDELFLAGGGSSVRGYSYRSIGIDVPGGISGGRSLFEASAEIRQDITDTIGMVGFVDVGHVNAVRVSGFLRRRTSRRGPRPALQYGSRPAAARCGVPLNRQQGDPNFAIYAGIGQAF
jgi:translocation and assembly module TamA